MANGSATVSRNLPSGECKCFLLTRFGHPYAFIYVNSLKLPESEGGDLCVQDLPSGFCET